MSTTRFTLAGQGLVTLTITSSLELTAVPGVGSILTTFQFSGARTIVYFGLADASVTLVSPRASSLSSAILAFCPVKSGIVIEDAVAVGAVPPKAATLKAIANRATLAD